MNILQQFHTIEILPPLIIKIFLNYILVNYFNFILIKYDELIFYKLSLQKKF